MIASYHQVAWIHCDLADVIRWEREHPHGLWLEFEDRCDVRGPPSALTSLVCIIHFAGGFAQDGPPKGRDVCPGHVCVRMLCMFHAARYSKKDIPYRITASQSMIDDAFHFVPIKTSRSMIQGSSISKVVMSTQTND
jgi:hypothetical protein